MTVVQDAEDSSSVEDSLRKFVEMIKRLPHQKDGEPDWGEYRSCELRWAKLKDTINETNLKIVVPAFDAVWQSHEPHDNLLDEVAACKTKFPDTGKKPQCIIYELGGRKNQEEKEKSDDNVRGDVRAILDLAGKHGHSLHQAMGKAVRETKGAYHAGPTKEFKRILYKAMSSYNRNAFRVVDVERATGIYDSTDDLAEAVRHLTENSELNIVRVKDNITNKPEWAYKSHYRDIKFNIMCNGLVGELQLHLREIYNLNKRMRCVYEVDRVVNDPNYQMVPLNEDGGLVSVPMLRLLTTTSDLERTAPEDLPERIGKALPTGCVYAGAYYSDDGAIMVCLGVKSVAALAKLRDEILLESTFKDIIAPRFRVDIGAFVDLYATNMMKFTELTLHQEEQLRKIQDADVALLLAPAGGGKTFVAVQRMLMAIQQEKDVLFATRNLPLALFVVRWLVIASRKNANVVVKNVRLLVDGKDGNFSDGPRCVRVIGDENERQLLQVGEVVTPSSIDGITVVDEAHHIASDEELKNQLRKFECSGYLFLGDLSQGCSTKNDFNKESVREILDLPKSQNVVVAKLAEVIRCTKRIVSGAASFQLTAASKEETETHSSSIGPPLESYLFDQVSPYDDDQRFRTYASHVVKALKSVQCNLDGVKLDDRVMIICPSDDFVEDLRGPLKEELRSQIPDQQYNFVSALESSAALPPQDAFSAASRAACPHWLVLDSIERVDGLERLIVIAVGLDDKRNTSSTEGDFQTRSMLYRALTRAQLAVAVVNEHVQGGWLEFLGFVKFDGGAYIESAERNRAAPSPADDVLVATTSRPGLQEKQRKPHSHEEKEIQPKGVREFTKRNHVLIRQNIWDTRVTIAEGSMNGVVPRFKPFLIRDKRYKSPGGKFWYQLTPKSAEKDSNFTQVCQEEFGNTSSIVDWSRDLKLLHERGEITKLLEALEIEQPFSSSGILVTENDEDYYSGTRKYFFENHGGNPPSNWAVHGQLGDITLGSWYVGGKILCKYPLSSLDD